MFPLPSHGWEEWERQATTALTSFLDALPEEPIQERGMIIFSGYGCGTCKRSQNGWKNNYFRMEIAKLKEGLLEWNLIMEPDF